MWICSSASSEVSYSRDPPVSCSQGTGSRSGDFVGIGGPFAAVAVATAVDFAAELAPSRSLRP
jgi:hypothetical protein